MDIATDVIYRLWDACLQLLTQPFYYIGIGFVVLLYRRKLALERKLFLTKLHSFLSQTWLTLLWGIMVGFIMSWCMLLLGVTIHGETLILIWIITLLFMLFRARFFCLSYAVGAIGISHVIVGYYDWQTSHHWLATFFDWIQQLHLPTLLALTAVAHIAEALLLRWSSARTASPLIVRGKRGRLIGGYKVEGFWIVPLFLVVPSTPSQHLIGSAGERFIGSSFIYDYFPLLGEIVSAQAGWHFLAFPFALGMSVWTTSMYAKDKARWVSSQLLGYSVIILALALAIDYLSWPVLALFAAIMCIVLHEGIVWYSVWREQQTSPLYTHDEQGLLVLGVITGSPAESLGIVPGEKVRQVNGMPVKTREDLHEAFNASPAFCKLEILNLDGQSKFMQRPIYAGEHHQLGLIFAPDISTRYAVKRKSPSLMTYFTLRDLK